MLPEELFPYQSFREGQKELSQSVYLACKEETKLVAEAMSGFGKTAAVLAGVLASAAEDDLKVIYVCRTKRQVFRVLEELRRFSGRHPLRATSLFSKYDYCLLRHRSFAVTSETFRWYCDFHTTNNLCSYFLNVGFNHGNIDRFIENQTTRPGPIAEFLQVGADLHVCPYEAARLSMARSQIIVTTYHYLLDEASRPILLSSDEPLGRVVAVIDEAHNIRDFLSSVSGETLPFSDLAQCINDTSDLHLAGISNDLAEVQTKALQFPSDRNKWFLDKPSFIDAITSGHHKDWLPNLVFQLTTVSGLAWLSVASAKNLPSSVLKVGSFFSALLSSLDSSELTLVRSESALTLLNTDPPRRFLRVIAGLRSVVLLSGTINPVDLFLRSIGLDGASTRIHTVPTANKFAIRTIIDTGVTTRFKMRTDLTYSNIAEKIAAICASTNGGVGVFLTSYALLAAVVPPLLGAVDHHARTQETRTVVVEKPGLSNSESDDLMRDFKSNPRSLLLAVQGGRFSEGEDFPGDQMDVSVVVGLPLPPPSSLMFAQYTMLEREGYSKHEAYLVLSLLPALRKSFQCAGRHVRDPGKVGMVFFLDSRFADKEVIGLMPKWLRDDLVKGAFDARAISDITNGFFTTPRG